MTKNNTTEDVFEQELTLLLLYLTSWTEGEGLAPRAWKNHRFELLRALTAKGYLFDSKGAKSVHLTAEGRPRRKSWRKNTGRRINECSQRQCDFLYNREVPVGR